MGVLRGRQRIRGQAQQVGKNCCGRVGPAKNARFEALLQTKCGGFFRLQCSREAKSPLWKDEAPGNLGGRGSWQLGRARLPPSRKDWLSVSSAQQELRPPESVGAGAEPSVETNGYCYTACVPRRSCRLRLFTGNSAGFGRSIDVQRQGGAG